MKYYQIITSALLVITKCSSFPYPDAIPYSNQKEDPSYKYNIEFVDKSEKGGFGYKIEVKGDDVSQHSQWNNQEQTHSQEENHGQPYEVPHNYHTIQEDYEQTQIPQHAVQILPNSYATQFGGQLGPQLFLESMSGKVNPGLLPQDSYQPNYVPNQATYGGSNFGFPQVGQFQQQVPHFEALQSSVAQQQYKYIPQFTFSPQTESPKQLGQGAVSYNTYQQDFGEQNSQNLVQKYQHTIQHDSYSNQPEQSNVEDNTKLYSQTQNQYYSNEVPQDYLKQYKDGILLAPLSAHKQIGQNIPKLIQKNPSDNSNLNQVDYQTIQSVQNYPGLKNYFSQNYEKQPQQKQQQQQEKQEQVFVAPYKLPDLPKSSKTFKQFYNKPESQVFEYKYKQFTPENRPQESNVEFQTLPNRLEHNYVIQKVNMENEYDEGPVKIVSAKQVKFIRPINGGTQQSQPTQQNVRHQPQKQQQEYVLQQYNPANQQQSHTSEQQTKYNPQKPRINHFRHNVVKQEQKSHTNLVQPNVPKKVVSYHYKQEEDSPYSQVQEDQFKQLEQMQQNKEPRIEYQMLSQPGLVSQLPMANINLQQQKNVQPHISESHQSNNIIAPFAHQNLFSGADLGYFNGGTNSQDLFGLTSQINSQQLSNLGGFNLGSMRRSLKNITTNYKPNNYRGKIKFVPDQVMIH